MANRFDGTSNGCIFQWKIENISHCWLKKEEKIESPKFVSDALEGTKWFLTLYPSGDFMQLYINREDNYVCPKFVTVIFELAVLDKDGTYLQKRSSQTLRFPKTGYSGFDDYEKREKVFVTHRDAFLPNDTLTVQCRLESAYQKPKTEMNIGDEEGIASLPETEHIFVRTTFSVNRRNFLCRIADFNTLKCDKKHTFKDSLIEFDLVLKESLEFGKKLVLIINSFDENIKYFSFKASIIDSRGKKENYCTHEYFEGDLKKGLFFTLVCEKKLMENKSGYLDCEYVYSNGTVSFKYSGCGINTPELTNESQKDESKNKHTVAEEKFETKTVMAKDLISMYNDRIFSDVEIRTKTQTFPAHKNILSARSPVFRRMLSNDMKEKISGHVDIDDLEDSTVHRMLLYMYTDALDDLQYENACKLYVAADKYEIISLRDNCASFMKNNLCVNQACDVLALADRHQDDDLKSAVCEFILRHDKEVFGSQEWKDFMVANKNLALDLMYRFTLLKI